MNKVLEGFLLERLCKEIEGRDMVKEQRAEV